MRLKTFIDNKNFEDPMETNIQRLSVVPSIPYIIFNSRSLLNYKEIRQNWIDNLSRNASQHDCPGSSPEFIFSGMKRSTHSVLFFLTLDS